MNHEQVFVHVNSRGLWSHDQLFAWNYILQRREVDAEAEAVTDDYSLYELMYCVFLLTDSKKFFYVHSKSVSTSISISGPWP